MSRIARLAPLALLALSLVACGKPTMHEVMAEKIDPGADEVWAIGNAAIGDDAGLDPAKMTDQTWDELAAKASKVQQSALELAQLEPLIVAKPGVTILDEGVEGGSSVQQVQANIDADVQGFRDMANTLAAHMGELAAAAKARDAAAAGPLISQLDPVCEACHLEFWYPGQRKLVEEIMQKAGDSQ